MELGWSVEERRRLREHRIDPMKHTRDDLVRLVRHFKSGGGVGRVVHKGDPAQKSQDFPAKIRDLVAEEHLDWLLDQPAENDQQGSGPSAAALTSPGDISQPGEGGQPSGKHRPPERLSVLDVTVRTDSDGFNIKSHVATSSTNPVSVHFSVRNRGPNVIRYLQLHVWLRRNLMGWDPALEDFGPWRDEVAEVIPESLECFADFGPFERYVLRQTAENGFVLMQSEYPQTLPTLDIVWRLVGMRPLPWRLECPGWPSEEGALLLWMDKSGRFQSESIRPGFDVDGLVERYQAFLEQQTLGQSPE